MKTPATAALIGLGLICGSALVLAQDEKTTKPAATPAPAAAPAAVAKDLKTKASYTIGLEYGKTIKRQVTDLELDVDAMLKGVRTSLTDGKPELSEAECAETMNLFQKQIMALREKKMIAAAPAETRATAEKNKKEGDAYLAANKGKPGVVTTKSGLQYKVVKEGKGAIPKASDTVSVHYKGTLIDGTTEFDSSYKRGKPATFEVTGVIPGWTEVLQLMKVGSKYQIVVPSELAYRFEGRPGIAPNSVLLFDVELIGIE